MTLTCSAPNLASEAHVVGPRRELQPLPRPGQPDREETASWGLPPAVAPCKLCPPQPASLGMQQRHWNRCRTRRSEEMKHPLGTVNTEEEDVTWQSYTVNEADTNLRGTRLLCTQSPPQAATATTLTCVQQRCQGRQRAGTYRKGCPAIAGWP